MPFLISSKYTNSDYLALRGGSNGGLLVGATITQRPDLAKVALPAVGVLDMLRYHKFTSGEGWAYDYGTSEESEEMFKYLLDYSPVHNVKKGVKYPATLITTGDHVLKFEVKCSTDKLEGLTKVPLDKFAKKKEKTKEEKVKNLGSEILYNQEVYIYIGIIAFFGIVLMFLMKGSPKLPPVPPPT